jgi:hypothetical protein
MKKLIELLSRWLWTGPTKGWLQLGMILALSVAASQACSDYEDGVLLGAVVYIVGLLIGFTAKPGPPGRLWGESSSGPSGACSGL